MNTRILVTAVFAVIILDVCAYFFIAPYVRTVEERGMQSYTSSKTNNDGNIPVLVSQKDVLDKTDPDGSVMSDDQELDDDREDEEEIEYEDSDDIVKPSRDTIVLTSPTPAAFTPPGYTLSQVALHSSETSCWSVVAGKVYDLTSFIPKHLGGEGNILKICGKDGTTLFEGQHGGDTKPESTLAGFYLGTFIQ